MKRIMLNIICIVLIIISCLGIVSVVNDAKNKSIENLNSFQPEEQFQGGMGEPPHMNNGEEPPAKPDGENAGMQGEHPERPSGDMENSMPQGERPNDMQGRHPTEFEQTKEAINKIKLQTSHIIIISLCVLVIAASTTLMIYTKLFSKNINKVFINIDKIMIFILINIIITVIGSLLITTCIKNIDLSKESNFEVDRGENVNTKEINLNNYNTNITINKSGEYTLTGSIKHSVLVDTDGEVVLNLNNVTIESTDTAAIANIGTNKITINLPEGTTNTLKDSGSGDYDGALFSNGELIINGEGILYVYGNQEEGEGIATTDNNITINGGEIHIESADDGINAGGDNGGIITINGGNITVKANGDGIDSNKDLIINGGKIYTMGSSIGGDAGIDTDGTFEINGGEVIALGSDMLQNPNTTSKQKYISFTLSSKINNESKVSLKNSKDKEIISFTAKEDFKTLIISNSELSSETYYLYVNDEKTEYSKSIE